MRIERFLFENFSGYFNFILKKKLGIKNDP